MRESYHAPPTSGLPAFDEFDDLGAKALALRAHACRRLARHLDHLADKYDRARTHRRRVRILRQLVAEGCDFKGELGPQHRRLSLVLEQCDGGLE